MLYDLFVSEADYKDLFFFCPIWAYLLCGSGHRAKLQTNVLLLMKELIGNLKKYFKEVIADKK